MSHSSSLTAVREYFNRQLAALGQQTYPLLDTYFPLPGKERTEMSDLLSTYAQTLKTLLEKPDMPWPAIVLIGSQVRVTYLEEQDSSTFTIVYPQDVDPDRCRISFLSPIGRQLLLRAPGDSFPILTPAGNLPVQVESVQFDFIA